jgi:hypothetical protein
MDQTVVESTREFLHTQIAALRDVVEKKDAYIVKLQDENSQKSQVIQTMNSERYNLTNTIKEYVIEAMSDGDISASVAESLSEICDFELTKTVTVTATVEFEVEVEVPFDTDAMEVANTLEFSVDSFDYSIDDFNVDTRHLQAEDNIS